MPANEITYSVTEDCATVVVTITELSATTGLFADVANVLTPQVLIENVLTVDNTTATLVFTATIDGVYAIRLQQAPQQDGGVPGEVTSEDILITCRGNACFGKLNHREVLAMQQRTDDEHREWLAGYALLRTAEAAFRTGRMETSSRLLAVLDDACKTFNCHCGC
jgi:hypothetical protein